MFALEEDNLTELLHRWQPRFHFKHLTLTLRMTDWWFWEDNNPLGIGYPFALRFQLPDTLDEFNLDLEVRNGKKNELVQDSGVEDWVFQVFQTPTSADETPTHITSQKAFRFVTKSASTWIGPSRIDGVEYAHHAPEYNGTPGLSANDMLYYILTLKWRKS
jgi:hypothetical protein